MSASAYRSAFYARRTGWSLGPTQPRPVGARFTMLCRTCLGDHLVGADAVYHAGHYAHAAEELALQLPHRHVVVLARKQCRPVLLAHALAAGQRLRQPRG
eukprot:2561168-Pyramimonas_sp.AAC.1